jgi:hypothetical protein
MLPPLAPSSTSHSNAGSSRFIALQAAAINASKLLLVNADQTHMTQKRASSLKCGLCWRKSGPFPVYYICDREVVVGEKVGIGGGLSKLRQRLP